MALGKIATTEEPKGLSKWLDAGKKADLQIERGHELKKKHMEGHGCKRLLLRRADAAIIHSVEGEGY